MVVAGEAFDGKENDYYCDYVYDPHVKAGPMSILNLALVE